MAKKLKNLSTEELLSLATTEFVQLALQYKNGDEHALEKTKYADELIRRGMKLGVSRDLIHRIFTGEFDNADGVEVNIKKVEGK
jgi:hypothetical protein